MQNILTSQVIDLIDWNEFFRFWKFKGKKYPKILDNKEAKKLFLDARNLLENLQKENFYCGAAKIEFFNAKSENDNIIIFPDAESNFNEPLAVRCLRQQNKKNDGEPYYCLADFVSPNEKIGVFALTSGGEFEKKSRDLAQSGNVYRSLLYQSLSERIVEAFCERYHKDYLNGRNGIRPAIGYPSIPDLRIMKIADKILNFAEIGISLSQSCMMLPLSSVCGFYITHPKVKYFAVGKIGGDQLSDYAERGNESVEEAKKWIGM